MKKSDKPSKTSQAGFGAITIITIFVVTLALIGISLVISKKSSNTKLSTKSVSPSAAAQTTSKTLEQPEQPLIDTKHYTNDRYGLSFEYPNEWRVEDGDSKLSYLDAESVELNLILVDTQSESSPTVAAVAVSKKPLSEVGPIGHGDMTQFKQLLTMKGNEAVKYSIPQTEVVTRDIYFIAANDKTFWVQTINEETNIQSDKEYVTKFNRLVDSLVLP